jgi:hypothetical protein
MIESPKPRRFFVCTSQILFLVIQMFKKVEFDHE